MKHQNKLAIFVSTVGITFLLVGCETTEQNHALMDTGTKLLDIYTANYQKGKAPSAPPPAAYTATTPPTASASPPAGETPEDESADEKPSGPIAGLQRTTYEVYSAQQPPQRYITGRQQLGPFRDFNGYFFIVIRQFYSDGSWQDSQPIYN